MKQKLIKDFLDSPLKTGESVEVKGVISYGEDKTRNCKIIKIEPLTVEDDFQTEYKINANQIVNRFTRNIGKNPFQKELRINNIQFSLDSILNSFGHEINREQYWKGVEVPEINWNPYVLDFNGKKQYYQRDFVWNLEDKQLLVESIYNYMPCGKIIVRKRPFEWVENKAKNKDNDIAWADVVDGKQRIKSILEFINNEFKDLYGNYYDDLSDNAQYKFLNHQLFSYSELPEDTTDEDTLKAFLMINHTGRPQSKEHIEFVKSLLDK